MNPDLVISQMNANISSTAICHSFTCFGLHFCRISFLAICLFLGSYAYCAHVISPSDIPEKDISGRFLFTNDIAALADEGPEPGKLSLVKFYTDYCFPCEELNRRAFKNKQLLRYVRRYFNPYKVDGFDTKKGGQDLAWQYNVHTFPTVLVTDPEGKELLRITGNVSAAELRARLAELEPVAQQMRAATRAATIPVLPVVDRKSVPEPRQSEAATEPEGSPEFGLLIQDAPDYYAARELAVNFSQNWGNQIWIERNRKGTFSLIYGAFATRKEAREIQHFFIGWEEIKFRIQALTQEGVSY